jgi:hypothetical protein
MAALTRGSIVQVLIVWLKSRSPASVFLCTASSGEKPFSPSGSAAGGSLLPLSPRPERFRLARRNLQEGQ